MLANTNKQEIIISGISGSGKTEAAKLMLAYLANACNNFKYLDVGDVADESKPDFDDSLTEDESSDSNEDNEGLFSMASSIHTEVAEKAEEDE